MNLLRNKKILINIFFSILLSSAIFLLSLDYAMWTNFWGALKIPPNGSPFSDLRAHIFFLECYNNGINIYEEACSLINLGNAKISTHPKIWIYLFDFLNLKNIFIFNSMILLLIFFYFFTILDFKNNFTKKYEKNLLLVVFFINFKFHIN